jgi:sugar lactone lactonase YvrE
VLYEALAGQLPFTGEGLTSTLMAIVSREAKPMYEVNPSVSMEVAAVVSKALRKSAPERFANVTEFLKEYEKAIHLSKPSPGSGSPSRLSLGGSGQSASSGQSYSPGIPMEPPGQSRGPGKAPVRPWSSSGRRSPDEDFSLSCDYAKPVGSFGKHGEDKGCFMEPCQVSARQGKIVVADSIKRKLQIFSRDARLVGESVFHPSAKGTKTGGGALSQPSALTIDNHGRIFACDSSDHYVRIYDGQGRFVKELHNRQGKEGGLLGIVSDASGYIYVSDPDNGCVHVMQQESGAWVRKLANKGLVDGQLQLPSGLALDRFSQLYVVDYGTSRVSVFSKAGIFQRAFGGKGTGKGLFNVPRGIAIDRYDRVYIADSLNHRIQVFNTAGDYLYAFGGRGQEPGRFLAPSDLCIDPENNCLYIADRGNSRIQVFELIKS